MNLAETHDLLTFAAVIDNRRFDDATVAAWQSILPKIDIDDALEAARRHYAASLDYLTPAHIAAGASKVSDERAARSLPAPAGRQAVAALPSGPQLGMRAIFEREGVRLPTGRPEAIGRRIHTQRPGRRPQRLADVIPLALANADRPHPVHNPEQP